MNKEIKTNPSLRSQSAWLLFAKIVGYFFAFLFPLLVVRFLSKEEVGSYRLIFQVIVNAVGILPLGFSLSVFYFLSRSQENRSRTIFNILLFNFLMGGIAFATFFFYPEILRLLLNSDELTRLAPLAGIVIWLWILGIFLEIVAVANQEPKAAMAFIILSQFTKTLFMISAVVVFVSVDAILYAAMAQAALQVIVLLAYLNSRFPRFWTSFNLGFFRKQAVYAMPFGFAGILWILQTDIHKYFVGYRFGEAGYAIYAYGCFEFPLIAMLYESISSVMIPKMSEFQSQGRTQDIIETSVSAMNKIALAYLPIFAFLMILATPLFITLFTESFLESVPIFRINMLLLPVYIFILDPTARAYKEVGRFLLIFRTILLIGIIAALWFGIQYFDLRGMIAIVVASIVFDRIVIFLKLRKTLDLQIKHLYLLRTIGMTAIAATISAAVLFAFYWFTKNSLYPYCIKASGELLASVGVEQLASLIGGTVYLGICSLIFAPVYYFSADMLSVIDEDEKALFKKALHHPIAIVSGLFKSDDDLASDA